MQGVEGRPGRVVRRRAEHGAAAVEFALVMPILMLILFGILQYGLYFNDSFNMRQGVREAARAGIVENFGCASATGNPAKLACTAKSDIGGLTASPYVKLVAPNGWEKGKALRVCALVKTAGSVGLLPMPNDGWVTAKIEMRIEQDSQKAAWSTYTDAAPSGVNWSWCT